MSEYLPKRLSRHDAIPTGRQGRFVTVISADSNALTATVRLVANSEVSVVPLRHVVTQPEFAVGDDVVIGYDPKVPTNMRGRRGRIVATGVAHYDVELSGDSTPVAISPATVYQDYLWRWENRLPVGTRVRALNTIGVRIIHRRKIGTIIGDGDDDDDDDDRPSALRRVVFDTPATFNPSLWRATDSYPEWCLVEVEDNATNPGEEDAIMTGDAGAIRTARTDGMDTSAALRDTSKDYFAIPETVYLFDTLTGGVTEVVGYRLPKSASQSKTEEQKRNEYYWVPDKSAVYSTEWITTKIALRTTMEATIEFIEGWTAKQRKVLSGTYRWLGANALRKP